jgi:hypothetical protein
MADGFELQAQFRVRPAFALLEDQGIAADAQHAPG